MQRLVSLQTAPHLRNRRYVQTKQQRMGHRGPGRRSPGRRRLLNGDGQAVDATALLGEVGSPSGRPFVVLKYAQTLDGRIATSGATQVDQRHPGTARLHALRRRATRCWWARAPCWPTTRA